MVGRVIQVRTEKKRNGRQSQVAYIACINIEIIGSQRESLVIGFVLDINA